MTNKNYSVYEHVFPNGKKYIGISSDPILRWNNGKGYEKQAKVYRAIKKYGWENIEHNIIIDGLNKDQAQKLEMYLIKSLNTIANGYNTSIGGENINTSYLDKTLLRFIREGKRYGRVCPIAFKDCEISMPDFCKMSEQDAASADWWNNAFCAVTKKHKGLKPTNVDDVFMFWFYMREFFILDEMIYNGKDISRWHEKHPYEYMREYDKETGG